MSDLADRADLNDQLCNIRRAFAAKLAGYTTIFQKLLAAAQHDVETGAALDEMRHLAHRLFGVAGSLGMDQLSEVLRQIETSVESGQAQGADPSDMTKTITPLVARFICLAGQASRS